MISPTSGFTFMIAVIIILILVSIQFTLNMILRELKSIRIRLGADPDTWQRSREHGTSESYKNEYYHKAEHAGNEYDDNAERERMR